MGEKNAPHGVGTKAFSARHRVKLLLPFCLLVVGIVWSTSTLVPFSSVAESRVFLRECANCGQAGGEGEIDAVGASTTLQHKESLNVQDGRDQEAVLAGPHRRSQAAKSAEDDDVGVAAKKAPRAMLRRMVDVSEDHEDAPAAQDEEEGDGDSNEVPEMEEADQLRTELSSALRQTKEQPVHGGGDMDISGDLNSKCIMYGSDIMEEIRSVSLPTGAAASSTKSTSCRGRYIYVYDLPPEFNVDLANRCDSLLPWLGLCDYFTNSGIGKPVATEVKKGSRILLPAGRWFNTNQYALELVSHARIMKYACRTRDASVASLFYIPYYGGLDVIRWHFASNATNEKRDELGRRLVTWLERQPSWTRRGGLDHVLVLGKISWDFRRPEASDWGSRLLEFDEMQQVTKLLIERNPWHRNDVGIPHPTFFHPRSAADIRSWLAHVAAQERTSIVSFVGKDRRGDPSNVRSALIAQCRNATTRECNFLECESDLCLQPAYVTKAFLTSHFCMQPPGDSPTRRSVFDSLVAGCIPVLFHPCTAYLQYPWHLPRNISSWSVYISEDAVKNGKADVVNILTKITPDTRDAMRRVIVDDIIPGLLYAEPGADIAPFKDSFDVVIENLLYRSAHLADLEQLAQN